MFILGGHHMIVSALSMQTNIIRIGTRPSPLAKIQARAVGEALRKISADELQIQIVEIITTDDQDRSTAVTQNVPLAVKSVDFTGALDQALLNNEIDAAVHSLKDVPPSSRWCDGLEIACCLPREDPMDVVVSMSVDGYSSIRSLPPNGVRVGTSSVRRQAQILSLRDDLELVNLRGNVEARLDALRIGKVDALILACAGLNRLMSSNRINVENFSDLKWHNLAPEEMLSGACQGIVGVAIRASDASTSDWLSKINDVDASITAAAERSFLDVLDSFRPITYNNDESLEWKGRPPLAALMAKSGNEDDENDSWTFQGMLARPDGSKVLRSVSSAPNCISMNEGKELGEACAKHLLEKAGPDFYQRQD